ncbi:hypothetical protein DUI87_20261 [Hirundo rustica rustica]|uniref:Synapsin pre-ATP-grasp domain-containing protein n=1 Tax=Hirundo rustica rustica TaxID=333673 RepID=A0A3M0JPW4_HIRRU|nr:hypothetical protein DUI87_20261 [Hirundo rustica rustica]
MNFLRRRLSDSSFVANLPNGYMMDLQRPDSSTSSPVSPATERKHLQPPQPSHSSSPSSSIFSSISSAMKQTTQAAAGLIDHSAGPAPPVAQKPKILLVIDDAHTDCQLVLKALGNLSESLIQGKKSRECVEKMLLFHLPASHKTKEGESSPEAKYCKTNVSPTEYYQLLSALAAVKERAKYFQGKKVNGEFDIRVEQAEFSELNLAAYVMGGCMVDMQVMRNGTKVVRASSFAIGAHHPGEKAHFHACMGPVREMATPYQCGMQAPCNLTAQTAGGPGDAQGLKWGGFCDKKWPWRV